MILISGVIHSKSVTWTKSSGPCGGVYLPQLTQACSLFTWKGWQREKNLRGWTLPSTPVCSWKLLNQFLLSKLVEKVKKFCSRLKHGKCLFFPRGSWVSHLLERPFKGKDLHLPRRQPETATKIPSVLPHSLSIMARGRQGWQTRGNAGFHCQYQPYWESKTAAD